MEVGLSLNFLSLHVQQFIAKYDLTLQRKAGVRRQEAGGNEYQ